MNLTVSSQFLTAVTLNLACYGGNELETVCSAAISLLPNVSYYHVTRRDELLFYKYIFYNS